MLMRRGKRSNLLNAYIPRAVDGGQKERKEAS